MVMNRTLMDIGKELVAISQGVSKGLAEIVIPPAKPVKLKWYHCTHCKKWYYVIR
jgi:hypothetical protein